MNIFNNSIPNHRITFPITYKVEYGLFKDKLSKYEKIAIITNDSIGKNISDVLNQNNKSTIHLFNFLNKYLSN